MSLETALAENTAALIALNATLGGGAVVAKPAAPETPAKPATTGKAAATAGKPATAPKAAATEGVAYEAVRDAVIALSSAKGRDAAIAVLTQFGVGSAKDLTAEQYAEAVAALTAALAGEDLA